MEASRAAATAADESGRAKSVVGVRAPPIRGTVVVHAEAEEARSARQTVFMLVLIVVID